MSIPLPNITTLNVPLTGFSLPFYLDTTLSAPYIDLDVIVEFPLFPDIGIDFATTN